MRSNTISTLAFMASSLLVKDVIAGVVHNHARVHKRQNYMIMVEEEVQVAKLADGSYTTGAPVPVRTTTVVVDPSPAPVAAVNVAPAVANSPPAAAVFAEQAKPTPAPAPVAPAEAPKALAAPVVEAPATTFATSVAAAPSPVIAPVIAPIAPVVAPIVAPTVAAPATSGGKRGVAFNDKSVLSVFSGKASWCYNWGQVEPSLPSGFEFVPMLWGNKAGFYDSWASNANKAIASGSTHLLAFNEPDLAEQSGMDVATAAADYKTHMQPFAGKAKLGAPSVTNGAGNMGLGYLGKFMSACTGCTIDFIPIHWYNGDALASSITYFKNHVAEAHTTGGNKPVWITEFQYMGGDEAGFLAVVIPWLEAQPYVERYSYFMASSGHLLDGTSLSAVGKAYVSA